MKLFHKLLVFNLLGKGVFLLVFLMLSPYLLSQLIIDNTDEELLAKKEEVLKLIQKGGIENFISNENPEQGFGSYNILKEEYILLVAVEADFSVDEPISIQKRIIF